MRRTTLGPVGARLNHTASSRRKSMAVPSGRKSMSGVPSGASKMRRDSAYGSRRSSVASRRGSVYGSKKKVDPRPLKDKEYRKTVIQDIIEFLLERNYDQQISRGILNRPTGRDFKNIVTFLLQRIDPDFHFKGSIESELPFVFKALKYPFPISKTALQSVGAPHTWPPLLGALAWLVELLKYDESSSNREEGSFMDESPAKTFYAYLSDAYSHYMAGDDAQAEALDEELAASFQDRNAQLQKATAEKETEIDSIRGKLEELTSTENSIEGLAKRRDTLASDLTKFKDLVGKLERRQGDLTSRLEATKADIAATTQTRDELAATIQTLKVRIENQELSAADVQHMAMEKKMLKESTARVEEQKAAAQAGLWELEMNLAKRNDELKSKIQTFHRGATELQLLPRNARHANGVDFEIRTGSSNKMLATDMQTIKSGLRTAKQRFTTQRFDAMTTCDDLNDAVAETRTAHRDAEKEIGSLEANLAKMDEEHKLEKANLETFLSAKRDEIEDVEAKIESVKKTIAEEAAEAEALTKAAIDKEEAEFLEFEAQLHAQRMAVREKIATALEYLTKHKSHVHEQLNSLVGELAAKRDEIREFSVVEEM